MSDKIMPVGGLAVHLDVICHWFLWRLEAGSWFAVKLLVLHSILCDGTWWKRLVQYII